MKVFSSKVLGSSQGTPTSNTIIINLNPKTTQKYLAIATN